MGNERKVLLLFKIEIIIITEVVCNTLQLLKLLKIPFY